MCVRRTHIQLFCRRQVCRRLRKLNSLSVLALCAMGTMELAVRRTIGPCLCPESPGPSGPSLCSIGPRRRATSDTMEPAPFQLALASAVPTIVVLGRAMAALCPHQTCRDQA